jgi:glycosyltransferase involved in cell wall biosynthesis
MKIIFNTRNPDAPASLFYYTAFKALTQISFYDWNSYEDYDIALFMTYKQDLIDLVSAKKNSPKLKVGLIDPRGKQVISCLPYVDFLIVDSLEMKDFFAGLGLPILMYAEYPDIKTINRKHTDKKKIIIGYHGNIVHLAGMHPHATVALEELSKKFSLELWAMYNIKNQGKCQMGMPANMKIRHIQWDSNNYEKILSKTDIGIVPNLMPIRNLKKTKRKATLLKSFFNETDDDYLVRYKMPSNPGRIIVFGKLGIPVVTDFYPSALQIIQDGFNGGLVYSAGGWYAALKELIEDAGKRNFYAKNMNSIIEKNYDFNVQNKKANSFFKNLLNEEISRESFPHRLIENMSCKRNSKFWFAIATMKINQFLNRLQFAVKKIRNKVKT